jgi:hypothetical protein
MPKVREPVPEWGGGHACANLEVDDGNLDVVHRDDVNLSLRTHASHLESAKWNLKILISKLSKWSPSPVSPHES